MGNYFIASRTNKSSVLFIKKKSIFCLGLLLSKIKGQKLKRRRTAHPMDILLRCIHQGTKQSWLYK